MSTKTYICPALSSQELLQLFRCCRIEGELFFSSFNALSRLIKSLFSKSLSEAFQVGLVGFIHPSSKYRTVSRGYLWRKLLNQSSDERLSSVFCFLLFRDWSSMVQPLVFSYIQTKSFLFCFIFCTMFDSFNNLNGIKARECFDARRQRRRKQRVTASYKTKWAIRPDPRLAHSESKI